MCLIESRIREICRKDPHVNEDGIYAIRSVYFDDCNNTCFYENENGTDPREKFRIRIYNSDAGHIELECKRKERGLTHKESCLLTREQCAAVLGGGFSWSMLGEEQKGQALVSKFLLQYRMRLLRPRVIVQYERTPYVYEVGNVRITFDRNISGTGQVQDFLEPVVRGRPVMPAGQQILEVKYDELLPNVLYNAMQLRALRHTAYSKYYICRKFCGL